MFVLELSLKSRQRRGNSRTELEGGNVIKIKPKKHGLGLEMRTFDGTSQNHYLVFRTKQGAFHVFQEVEAKEAARDCGKESEGNTRLMWQSL